MYLEFPLPGPGGGMVGAYTRRHLNNELNFELQTWADRYDIAYTQKMHKHTVRIAFDDDKLYAFFVLTWRPQDSRLLDYVLRDPMRIDRHR